MAIGSVSAPITNTKEMPQCSKDLKSLSMGLFSMDVPFYLQLRSFYLRVFYLRWGNRKQERPNPISSQVCYHKTKNKPNFNRTYKKTTKPNSHPKQQRPTVSDKKLTASKNDLPFLHGLFPGDFQEENSPLRPSGEHLIKPGKRVIKEGKRSIKASGVFWGTPAIRDLESAE